MVTDPSVVPAQEALNSGVLMGPGVGVGMTASRQVDNEDIIYINAGIRDILV